MAEPEVETGWVKVEGGVIAIRRRKRAEPVVQLKSHIPPALARRLRLFAAANDLTIQDVVRAGIEAVVGDNRGPDERPAA
jgi:hypothetical protein